MGNDKMEPQIVRANFTKSQHRWTGFLGEMERSLPGISGAARNLLATLVFGLHELSRCAGRKRLEFKVLAVEAFARFLVRRMANARATIIHAAEVARRKSQISRVFKKLSDMPIDARVVYKNLKIAANDCHGCLRWLEASNLARQLDSRWERVEGAQLTFNAQPLLVLDV